MVSCIVERSKTDIKIDAIGLFGEIKLFTSLSRWERGCVDPLFKSSRVVSHLLLLIVLTVVREKAAVVIALFEVLKEDLETFIRVDVSSEMDKGEPVLINDLGHIEVRSDQHAFQTSEVTVVEAPDDPSLVVLVIQDFFQA
jgi:hypothetical protein